MNKKKRIISGIVLSFLIIASMMLVSAKELESITIVDGTTDIFKTLDVNDNNGFAEFTMINPDTVLTSSVMKFSFIELTGHVKSHKILVQKECIRQEKIFDYTESCETLPDESLNCTQVASLKETIDVPYTCWEEFDSISVGESKFRIEADIEFGYRSDGEWGYEIDWIPEITVSEIVYKRTDWAWWNYTAYYENDFTVGEWTDWSVSLGTPIQGTSILSGSGLTDMIKNFSVDMNKGWKSSYIIKKTVDSTQYVGLFLYGQGNNASDGKYLNILFNSNGGSRLRVSPFDTTCLPSLDENYGYDSNWHTFDVNWSVETMNITIYRDNSLKYKKALAQTCFDHFNSSKNLGFRLRIRDTASYIDYMNLSFTNYSVTSSNSAPSIDDYIPNTYVNFGDVLNVSANISDVDADPLTCGVNDTRVTINAYSDHCEISDTPDFSTDYNLPGGWNITYNVSDGTETVSSSFIYYINYSYPSMDSYIANSHVFLFQSLSVSMNISDADGDTLTCGVNDTRVNVVEINSDDVNFDINASVYQYELGVGAKETQPQGIAFSNDGTQMFISGNTGNDVTEYSLSTAWNIGSASYVQEVAAGGNTRGIAFSSDGTKFYQADFNTDAVTQYNLSSAFTITGMVSSHVFDLSTWEGSNNGVAFNNDGTKMFTVGYGNNNVTEFTLSEAWHIASATHTSSFTIVDGLAEGVRFDTDGDRMFVGQLGSSPGIRLYDLSSPFDLTTTSRTTTFLNLNSIDANGMYAFFFKTDGSQLYTVGIESAANSTPDVLYQFYLPTTISSKKCEISDTPSSSDYNMPNGWNITYNVTDGFYTTSTSFIYWINVTPLSILFNIQIPIDLTTYNVMGAATTSFNITSNTIPETLDTVIIYHKLNSSTSDIERYENGTSFGGWESHPFSTTISGSTYTFGLDDNYITPGTYPISQDSIEKEKHAEHNLTKSNHWMIQKIYNISLVNFTIAEVMFNTSGTKSGQIWYCNSSYQLNTNVNEDRNCTQVLTLSPSTLYNHSHGDNSSHMVIPMAIKDGKISDVGVSQDSYLALRGRQGATWKGYYVTQQARVGNLRYSTNGGETWTNIIGTLDMHIHQFDRTDTLSYYVWANDSYSQMNSSLITDLIGVVNVPPTPGKILNPSATNNSFNHSGTINITYLEAVSPNGTAIKNYTINLFNQTDDFVQKIWDNELNLSYLWSPFNLSHGNYSVRIQSCDIADLCANGTSEEFLINNYVPVVTTPLNKPRPVNYTQDMNWTFNVTNDDGDLTNLTIYIYVEGVKVIDDNRSNVASGSVLESVVGTENFTWNETITINITPIDSALSGAEVTASVNAGVNNLAVISSVAISGSSDTDTLTGSYVYWDADDDPDSSTFRWYKNGVVIPDRTTTTLYSGDSSLDDVIIFEVTSFDGREIGLEVNSSALTITQYVSGGGGGGGGSSQVQTDESAKHSKEIGKGACSITLAQGNLTFTDDTREQKVTLTNNEAYPIDIKVIVQKFSEFNSAPGTWEILPDEMGLNATSQISFILKHESPFWGHGVVDTKMALVIQSDECNEIVFPVIIRLSDYAGFKELPVRIMSWVLEQTHEKIPVLRNGMILLLMFMMWTGIMWGFIEESMNRSALGTMGLTVVVFFLTVLTSLLTVFCIRVWL